MTYKVTVIGSVRLVMCPDCGEMHDKNAWPDNHRKPDEVLCVPMVIRDEMEPVQNQHDGKFYTSKRAIRASYMPSGNKEGVRLVEIGDQKQKRERIKPDRKGIKDAVQRASARLANGEVTRETYEKKVLTRPGKI